jgi:hypothetical protein
MGGERASTVRQRESGKICCQCKNPLDPPPPGYKPGFKTGERYCPRCAPRPHKVTMRFERYLEGWQVFLTVGNRPLRTITFGDSFKIEAMAEKGGAFKCLADRQAVEYALNNPPHVGVCLLNLTEEQMMWLRA